MLQKVNLVLMIVVLVAVGFVSVQMFITQRYNTLALNALEAHLADVNATLQAAERSRPAAGTGVVYLRGEVARPGVYNLPLSGGLTLMRLLSAAGTPADDENLIATLFRGTERSTVKQEFTISRLFGNPRFDVELEAGDTVAVRKVEPGEAPSLDAEPDWQEVAEEERAKAEALRNFLVDVLAAADPQADHRSLPLDALLDDAASRLEAMQKDNPEVAAKVRQAIEQARKGGGS
jgi:protein involved in polysaccharide export with SLBB domain